MREDREMQEGAHQAVTEKQLEELGLEPDIEPGETRAERYRRMHREALLEALERLREGRQVYSRRIIGIWSYQRERRRMAG